MRNEHKNIKVKLPQKANPEFSSSFSTLNEYEYRIPQLVQLNKVFVSHDGLVLKYGQLVRNCAFNIYGNRDLNFKRVFRKLALEQMLVSRFGKSLPYVRKRDKTYAIVHTKWFNYAFWMNSSIPRLLMLEKSENQNFVLLIPEKLYAFDFVKETLKAFDFQIELIPDGQHLFIDELLFPQTRDWSTEFDDTELSSIRNKLIPIAKERCAKDFTDQRVYLSRKKRNVRTVENESELQHILDKYNFKTYFFEDLNVWEQIVLMNQAKVFISIHGAGCTNILFMKEHAVFIELINKPYAHSEYKFPFWKLATLSGLVYLPIFCEIASDEENLETGFGLKKDEDSSYLVQQNIIVDCDELQSTIEEALHE